jgi:hypothetical protein
MDPSVAGLVGVGIGAVVGFLSSLLSNWFTTRREREQRRHEQQAEQVKWLRDRLQEIYGNSLYYASHSNLQAHIEDKQMGSVSDAERARLRIEAMKLDDEINRERHKWFNMLLIYPPYRDTAEYDAFQAKLRERKLTDDDIMELAADDPSLRGEMEKWESELQQKWLRSIR